MLYLIAGNGAPNYGDELIVQNWLRFYREIGYLGPITVDGKGADRSRQLLSGYGDVQFVKGLPRHADGMHGTYTDFAELGALQVRERLSDFRDVIALHFLGGGYLSANWNNATRLIGGAVEIASLNDIPLIATGLGLAPFNFMSTDDHRTWEKLISAFSLLEVRDIESYRTLLNISAKKGNLSLLLGLDDAFLFPVKAQRHEGRWLHLSGFSENPGWLEASIKDLLKQYDEVIFWICSVPDSQLYRSLSKRFPNIQKIGNFQLLNHGLPLMQDDFMISARFHPHLQASRRGVSGAYLAESDFYRVKHGLVSELGSTFQPFGNTLKVNRGRDGKMQRADPGRVDYKTRIGQMVCEIIGFPPKKAPVES